MATTIFRRSFNAGEFSPSLKYRNDFEKYNSACETLENFLVTPQGALEKRKGSYLIRDLSEYEYIHIIPFEYNRTQSNILAFCITNGKTILNVLDVNGTLLYGDIATNLPSTIEYLLEVQYYQINDVMYFAHSTMPPQRLERDSEGSFAFVESHITIEPVLDTTEDNLAISYSPPAWSSSTTYYAGDWATSSSTSNTIVYAYLSASDTGSYALYLTIELNTTSHGYVAGDEISVSALQELEYYKEGNIRYTAQINSSVGTIANVSSNLLIVDVPFLFKKYESSPNPDFNADEEISDDNPQYYNEVLQATYTSSGSNGTIFDGSYTYFLDAIYGPNKYISLDETKTSLASKTLQFYQAIKNNKNIALTNTSYWQEYNCYYGTCDITSNIDYFTESMEGTMFSTASEQSTIQRDDWGTSAEGSASTPVLAKGTVALKTEGGRWDGTLELQESFDRGITWQTIASISTIDANTNVELSRDIDGYQTFIRVYMRERNTADEDTGCKWILSFNTTIDTYFKITEVVSATEAKIQLITPLAGNSFATSVYRGAWNSDYGYPRSLVLHEERLCFAGNDKKPCTIWLSATNNWNDFSLGELATNALAFTLSADQAAPINGLVSRSDLLILTDVSEWSLGSRDSDVALSAEQVYATEQTCEGSEYIKPVKASNFLFFIKRGSQRLLGLSYDYMLDGYQQTDLTVLSSHILSEGVNTIFNLASPDNVIWCILKNGSLVSFTFDKENNVSAWARHTLGDSVLSGCALSTGSYKDLFFVVKRNEKYYLERIKTSSSNYKDCAENINSDMEIPEELKDGVIYTSKVITTAMVHDKRTRISLISLHLIDSYGGKVRLVNERGECSSYEAIKTIQNGILSDTPISADLDVEISVSSGFQDSAKVEVIQAENAPFNLCAIGCNINRFGD